MDFYATLGGCTAGLLVSRFVDFFTRQMKLCLLLFYLLAGLAALWLTLLVEDVLPFDTVSVYAAIVIGGVFLDGGAPLFFELVIEVSYPVGEGVTSGFLQMLTAFSGVVFLSLLQIESIGKQWMNWCFFGCIAAAVPLLYFIDTVYGRADIDDMEVDVSADVSVDVSVDDDPDVSAITGGDYPEKQSLLNGSYV
ncbi:solute carrier family 49 member 4 [Aplysia californica]|uniref:Solute carrier family 49 member 4 n=1 Tax=Aplysia californica TaxID=6500 RepID=A0ABM1AFH4_APLCA|nr:solute carrier family 49 member 4 [Aplysia californica]